MSNLQPHDVFTVQLNDNPFQCDLSSHNSQSTQETTKQLKLFFSENSMKSIFHWDDGTKMLYKNASLHQVRRCSIFTKASLLNVT